MTYRCIITKEKDNYYIGKDYHGTKYKILKNNNIDCSVGDDFYFYAKLKESIFSKVLVPISDKEAGVTE